MKLLTNLKTLLICLTLSGSFYGQSPVELVKQVIVAANSQKEGIIRAKEHFVMGPDGYDFRRTIECVFSQSPLNPANFIYYTNYSDSAGWMKQHFNGDNLMIYFSDSDTIRIQRKEDYGEDFQNIAKEMLVSLPYAPYGFSGLPLIADLDSGRYLCEILKSEEFPKRDYQLIRLTLQADTTTINGLVKEETLVWIEPKSKLIRKYQQRKEYHLEGDKMHTFQELEFEELNFNAADQRKKEQEYVLPAKRVDKIILPEKKVLLIREGQTAPDWKAFTVDGKEFTHADFKGKLILIDFFFRGCTGCMQVMPDIIEISKKYDENKLVVISMDPIDNPGSYQDMNEWLQKKGMTQHVLFAERAVAQGFGIPTYPSYVLVDPNGKVVWSKTGFDPELEMKEVFSREIEKQLKK